MTELTRRGCLTSGLALGLGTPAAGLAKARTAKTGGIKLTEVFSPGQTARIKLARQIGLNYAIVGVSGALARVRREQYVETLTRIKSDFGAAGLKIAGCESHPVPAERIKLGAEGRDE